MPEATVLHRARVRATATPGERPVHTGHRLVVEHDPVTGDRLKYYSRTADVAYWTELWRQTRDVSYAREERGHLPHQLRGTFSRWVRPGARVLEAGCGPGRFTVAAAARGYRAEGIDWSAGTIETLRKRFPSIAWHVGDVRRLHVPDGTFDAVYSPGVCEHFEEGPAAVLAETHRVLRRGGLAIVSTPCFNTWLQRRASRLASAPVPAAAPFYQYAFTPDGMATLLGQLGFDVLQVRPYAVLDMFVRYGGWRIPAALTNILALPVDYLPVVRRWGSTCIWVARKC
ncbi:MAG: class I SAM-dependent methyltransferase [Acidobacteria bacterium]|nr:class I SAM-dependent methyltransferase [Acidobacteriota bacterium]